MVYLGLLLQFHVQSHPSFHPYTPQPYVQGKRAQSLTVFLNMVAELSW